MSLCEPVFSADEARYEALRLAVDLYAGRDSSELREAVTFTARHFAAILRGRPVRLVLHPAPVTFEQGRPGLSHPTILTGASMSVTMTDAQQVAYAVEPRIPRALRSPTQSPGPATTTARS